MVDLYSRDGELPPVVQMFMEGCPKAYEERRQRWAARDLVMRNLLALSMAWGCGGRCAGTPPPRLRLQMDPRHVMTLLFDKFKLLGYEGHELTRRYPAADGPAGLSGLLDGVTSVRSVDGGNEAVYAFEVDREGRGPLLAAWWRHDGWDGEEQPPQAWSHPWTPATAVALDTLGNEALVTVRDGEMHLPLGLTPVLVQ